MRHTYARIDELKHNLLERVPCFPDNDTVKRQLSSLGFSEVLLVYVNWVDRFVAPRPRDVIFAEEFWSNEKSKKYESTIRSLVSAITEGRDITAHLSEEIHTKGYAPLEGKWGDKDFCLNAYGVHHLHLGSRILTNGLIERTRDLLYVKFTRTTATFLIVGDHQSFNDGTLEVPVRKERIQEGLTLKGTLPGEDLTPQDRRSMERRGLSTCSNAEDGPVPLALQSMSGIGMRATKHVSEIKYYLYEIDKRLDDGNWVHQYLADFTNKINGEYEFSWRMNLADLVLCENTSQKYMTCVQWIR